MSELRKTAVTWHVAEIVSALLVAMFISKAIRIWVSAPRRPDGTRYSHLSLEALLRPQTPQSKSTETLLLSADDDNEEYTLAKRRPRSLARLQISQAQEEEELFSVLASLMRQVARGFTVRAVLNALIVMHATHTEGLAAFPGFFDTADELTFAFLIRSASAGFEACAGEVTRQHGDVTPMIEALQRLRELWIQMRLPLLIQSIIKLVQLILKVREGLRL